MTMADCKGTPVTQPETEAFLELVSPICDDPNFKLDEVALPVNSNFQSRLNHEAHPMHSDLILVKIFANCSVSTLKSCRLVCTKWLALSLKSWRQKAVLGVQKLIDQNELEDLLNERSELLQKPFKCYDIAEYSPESSNFDVKNTILNKFSSSIQYLDFDCDIFRRGMSLILWKLPDLLHLKMRFYYDYFVGQCQEPDFYDPFEDGQNEPFENIQDTTPFLKLTKLQLNFAILYCPDIGYLEGEIPWSKLFRRTPALTSLHVKYKLECRYSGGKRAHYRFLRQILQEIQKVRESEMFTTLNLEELDIMIHANHSCISIPFPKTISDIIVQSKLPLERLCIDIGTNCNSSCIENILAAHGETLKYLKAISAPNKIYLKKKLSLENFLPNKIALPKLKELELLNGCVWAFHFLCSLVVPELDILRIEEMKLKQHRRFEKLNWKSVDANCREEHLTKILDSLHFPNLKRFYYSGPRHLSPTELQLLANAMPNVTDLGVPLSAKTFPVICEIWTGLKSLQVGQAFDGMYPLIDDYAITGLPGDDNLSESTAARDKNITDLKKLWSFELEGIVGQSFSRRPMITDVSVVFGFLLLPKLTVLRIGGICKFSPELLTTLESAVSDVRINVHCEISGAKCNINSSDSSCDESESESEYSEPDVI